VIDGIRGKDEQKLIEEGVGVPYGRVSLDSTACIIYHKAMGEGQACVMFGKLKCHLVSEGLTYIMYIGSSYIKKIFCRFDLDTSTERNFNIMNQ